MQWDIEIYGSKFQIYMTISRFIVITYRNIKVLISRRSGLKNFVSLTFPSYPSQACIIRQQINVKG